MISFEEAIDVIDAVRPDFGEESVSLDQAHGRRLGRDIFAPFDSPPFSNSAMDGYAVGSPEGPWRLVASVPAGCVPEPLGPGEAARIFTGAMVPVGTVAVLPQEEAHHQGDTVTGSVIVGRHIRRQGEELGQGAPLVSSGTRIDPIVISTLAAFGMGSLLVRSLPRVALAGTGDELLSPAEPLTAGKIFESNSYTLSTALRQWGSEVTTLRLRDRCDEGARAIEKLLDGHAVLVTIGGISVGEYDWVHQAVSQLGFETRFRGVAMKPGKPVAMGTRSDGKFWFGLPGNPLSALVTFSLFVARFLREDSAWMEASLREAFEHRAGRDEFVPAEFDGRVSPRRLVGSHAVTGAVGSSGLARFDGRKTQFAAGDPIPFTPWPWRSVS